MSETIKMEFTCLTNEGDTCNSEADTNKFGLFCYNFKLDE